MAQISQLYFTHGESVAQIVKALEKSGYRVDAMYDEDLRQVYPEDFSGEQRRTIDPKKGEFVMEKLNFKFDKIILVYTAPVSPDFEGIYYAQTFI